MASKRTDTTDPYAPPPMYHDKSGRVLRVGLIAVLLAAVAIGYFTWSANAPPQSAAIQAPAAQQRLADNGYRVQPEQIPQVQPASPVPPAAAPAPVERARPAPTRRTRSEVSEPEQTTPPASMPTAPAPLPPLTATPQLPDATPPAQG